MNNNNYNKLFDSSFFSTPQKSDKENSEQKIFNPSQNIFSNAAASIGQNMATSGLPQTPLVPGGMGQGIFSPKAALPGSAGAGSAPQGVGGTFVPGVFGGSTGLGAGASPVLGNTGTGFAAGGSTGPFTQTAAPQGFGAASTPFGSVFGSGAGNAGARPAYAAPPANSIFGAATTTGMSTGSTSAGFGGGYGFGSTGQGQATAVPFGGTPSTPAATPSIFNTASTPTPNLFNNNSTSSPFGTAASTSANPFSVAGTATSPFGTAAATSSPFAKNTAPGIVSSPFGQTALGQQSSSAFTAPAAHTTTPAPSAGFGGSVPLVTAPGPLMAPPSPFAQTRPFSDFGPGVSKGTKDPRYQESRVREDTVFVNLKDICGMKEYQPKSITELRLEDYNLGRRRVVETQQQQQPAPQQAPLIPPFVPAAQPAVQTSVLQPTQPSAMQTAQQPGPVSGSQQAAVFEKHANPNDPFLIDEIKIEKIELPAQPIKKKIPKPDFKREKAESMLKVVLREPAPHTEIETIPSQEDIKKMESTNLVIIFKEGRIEYLEKIKAADALISNIESKVFFNKDEVSVNDVVGVGLNKRARVYVNNYFPFSKKSRSFIRDEALVYELKRDPRRRFVEPLMKELGMIPSVLESVSTKESIDFINKNYAVIGPFMAPHLESLQALNATAEGRVALSKIYFSLQRYDEAISCLEGVSLRDDGSFFYNRMMFWIMDRYHPPQEMNVDALGYLFEKGRFEEIKKCRDFSLISRLIRKERAFYNWVRDNCEVWGDNSVDALYLKIDALSKKRDTRALQALVDAQQYPLNYVLSYYLFDNYPFISRCLQGNSLLNGSFQKQVYLNFLAKNNKTDFNFLNSLGRHNNKFDSRIITLLSNSIMNMGTTNDSLYRLNTDLIANSKPWNRFIGTAVLGNIHVSNENPYEILQKYLPNEGDLKRGGSLLALGFINKLECRDEDIEFFSTFLADKNLSGEIQYGAALGLGLVAMGSCNANVLENYLKLLHSMSVLIVREGVLISIGMINAGQAHEGRVGRCAPQDAHGGEGGAGKDTVDGHKEGKSAEDLLNICEGILLEICRESEHERESRAAGIGLALSVIGTERLFPVLVQDKNEVARYSGALALGASFAGTGNLEIISKLLDLTNDCDDNVKRAAVFGLGLVCSADRSLLLNILKPLATSYSPSVRATVALSLGLFMSGTGDLEASNVVEALLYDNSSLVVQQAGIGLGLLLMQCNSHINPNFKRMVERLNRLTIERAEDCSFKFGAVLGRAMMEAGGTNIVISVLNSMNLVETSRVVGAVLFFQYWFWYPFLPFISLCMKHTGFFVFDENLKHASQEVVVNEKKSRFDYEHIRIEEPKKHRRFKRKEQQAPKKAPVVVEEEDSYVIKSGDRMSLHELSACNREDHSYAELINFFRINMEWKSLVNKINELKESGDSFIAQLQQLEDVKASAYDQMFIDSMLSVDYEFYDEVHKSEMHARKAIAAIEDYMQNTVLGTKDLIYLVDLLEKCYISLLKHELIEPADVCKSLVIQHIRSSGHQLFFFFLLRASAGLENILHAADFMNTRLVDHLRELFDAAFSFYDASFQTPIIEKIQSVYLGDTDFRSNSNNRNSNVYAELMINFLVLDDDDYEYYVENVRNILISRKNNLEDLHRIFLNCLKVEKYGLIGRILQYFVSCKEVFTEAESGTLKSLMSEYAKIDHSPGHGWARLVNAEDFAKFLFKKKMFSEIVDLYEGGCIVPSDYAFCSYIELGEIEKAQKIFDMEQVSKYGFDCNYDRIPLSDEYVFRLHLKNGNHSASCNILQSAKTIEDFIDLTQIIYAENDMKLLIEAIYIGLDKFKTTDFKMLQVFISLLHIDQLDISILDRAEMILRMARILDIRSLSGAQKEWMRSVCFNNILDLIDVKCSSLLELTQIMHLFDLDIDSIYLCLCVYSRKDTNTAEHRDRIKKLYTCFSSVERPEDCDEGYYKTLALFYKCYSIIEDAFADEIFNMMLPFKKLTNNVVVLLLNFEAEIINKLFDRKISVIKEGERRGLLDSSTIYAFITNLSIQGPHVSVLFLEKLVLYIDSKHLRSNMVTKIIMNQRALLEIIGDRSAVNKVNLVLEKIRSSTEDKVLER
ncbi:UNVERIFIED_CONTAM: hypothetical protein PYX00_011383 [Menopon gallinae]|uniref:26S proteasome non-ATPase regulatory subunit 1 homolog n=1 Tax=Menopon gallinae TaxID=328185 RepID=A0AAW2H7D4_9NEOP